MKRLIQIKVILFGLVIWIIELIWIMRVRGAQLNPETFKLCLTMTNWRRWSWQASAAPSRASARLTSPLSRPTSSTLAPLTMTLRQRIESQPGPIEFYIMQRIGTIFNHWAILHTQKFYFPIINPLPHRFNSRYQWKMKKNTVKSSEKLYPMLINRKMSSYRLFHYRRNMLTSVI